MANRECDPAVAGTALARAEIVTLAKKLDLGVVAEGVETAAQLSQLQKADCEHGQGYLFSQPTDAATVHAALRRTASVSAFPVISEEPVPVLVAGARAELKPIIAEQLRDVLQGGSGPD